MRLAMMLILITMRLVREDLSNEIGFEVSIIDTGLALDPGMSTGLA